MLLLGGKEEFLLLAWMTPRVISSAANPIFKKALRLRGRSARQKEEGVFFAEGERAISRALAAGLRAKELFLAEGATKPEGFSEEAPTFLLPEKLFCRLAFRQKPEGSLALFSRPEERGLPTPSAKDFFLLLAGLEKPGNLGAMARTAAATGCAGVLLIEEEARPAPDPFHPNAIHASTGAVFQLPIFTAEEGKLLAWLEKEGVSLFAAAPAGETDFREARWKRPAALAIGAEDCGLPENLLAAAGKEGRLQIPQAAGVVDSLNAAAAAAILLFAGKEEPTL